MVSSFSNPGFPPVHAHPTRLPAMDARISTALNSFEASMRDAVREAMDSTLAAFHREFALLRRDLALGTGENSTPAPMPSDDAEILDLGHQKLPRLGIEDREGNPQRIPLKIQVHSIPLLLSSSPLLKAMANSPVPPPHSNAFVSATIPLRNVEKTRPVALVTTTPLLFPISATCSSESAYAHSHKPVLSTKEATTMAHVLGFPLRNARATSAGLSHTNTTKRRHAVLRSLVYNLSHWKAKWHRLLHFILAYYTGVIVVMYEDFLNEKLGWINWYLVGKFVKTDESAFDLFDEMSKRGSEGTMETSQMEDCESIKDTGETIEEGDYHKLLISFKKQKKELQEMRSAMEELKKQNHSKSRECQEACNSLKELQNELMRKSMHVGSLVSAIEGQVKEKSGWFSSLRDLIRKLKIMEI